MLVIQHQPHRALAHFRGKLVRRLAHDGSTFSGVGASGKPGAVQFFWTEPARADPAKRGRCDRPVAAGRRWEESDLLNMSAFGIADKTTQRPRRGRIAVV